MLSEVILKTPKPDIETFCKVIKREIIPRRPPLVELFVDQTLMKYLMEQKIGIEWIDIVPGDNRVSLR